MFVPKSKIKKAQESVQDKDINNEEKTEAVASNTPTNEGKDEKDQQANPQVSTTEEEKKDQTTTDATSETSDLKDIEVDSDEESSESDDENIGFGDFEDDDDAGWITPDNVDAYTK